MGLLRKPEIREWKLIKNVGKGEQLDFCTSELTRWKRTQGVNILCAESTQSVRSKLGGLGEGSGSLHTFLRWVRSSGLILQMMGSCWRVFIRGSHVRLAFGKHFRCLCMEGEVQGQLKTRREPLCEGGDMCAELWKSGMWIGKGDWEDSNKSAKWGAHTECPGRKVGIAWPQSWSQRGKLELKSVGHKLPFPPKSECQKLSITSEPRFV